MKIFNEVNGKELVNVQVMDIMFLSNSKDIAIPASIFLKVLDRVLIVDDSNRFDFVEFEDPVEIKFFKGLEWIIDYNKYIAFSDEDLEKKYKEEVKSIDNIVDIYNGMSQKEKAKNQHLVLQYECKNYKVTFIKEINLMKFGKSRIKVPEHLQATATI